MEKGDVAFGNGFAQHNIHETMIKKVGKGNKQAVKDIVEGQKEGFTH